MEGKKNNKQKQKKGKRQALTSVTALYNPSIN